VLHASVQPEQRGHVLNACLVGLAARSGTPAEPPACLGVGLVRAVDMAQGLLYLLTPVDLGTLEQVTILQVSDKACTHHPIRDFVVCAMP
jgi:polynucleotide 5'-hydroxyl-kinase GRC3/NOL9